MTRFFNAVLWGLERLGIIVVAVLAVMALIALGEAAYTLIHG